MISVHVSPTATPRSRHAMSLRPALAERPRPSQETLRERRAHLQQIIPVGALEVCVADQVIGHGVDLFAEICRRDLEGLVAEAL